MTEVDTALASATGDVNVQIQALNLSGTVQTRPSIVLVNPSLPYNTTVLLENFFGRQFNSLNDIKVLLGSGHRYHVFSRIPRKVAFDYGWLIGFRPEAMLPPQVYRFDLSTGQVRVVADQFVQPNGIAFTHDGKTAFVYQFRVDPATRSFKNRRVFAYVDSGIADGIQLDTMDNVYSGCGDGTHVWNCDGTLIGKFFLNSTTAEIVLTKSGLVILDEEAMYLANIQGTSLITY
ncbi:hypothetical protein BDN67DRAFT_1010587 [Paxillus ammoniavirescens]|nr:hypothetical protein BDN67DRAFT_1010587 [Paxillus ammoniavirescens]